MLPALLFWRRCHFHFHTCAAANQRQGNYPKSTMKLNYPQSTMRLTYPPKYNEVKLPPKINEVKALANLIDSRCGHKPAFWRGLLSCSGTFFIVLVFFNWRLIAPKRSTVCVRQPVLSACVAACQFGCGCTPTSAIEVCRYSHNFTRPVAPQSAFPGRHCGQSKGTWNF